MKEYFAHMKTDDVKHEDNLADAIAISCEKEQDNHESIKAFNRRDYESRCADIEKIAEEYYVINGQIYYTYKMDGCEQGLTFLNRFELISALHDGPFYRVSIGKIFYDVGKTYDYTFAVYCDDEGNPLRFKRDPESRKHYAKEEAMMCTDLPVQQ